jgi:hypothetical protein
MLVVSGARHLNTTMQQDRATRCIVICNGCYFLIFRISPDSSFQDCIRNLGNSAKAPTPSSPEDSRMNSSTENSLPRAPSMRPMPNKVQAQDNLRIRDCQNFFSPQSRCAPLDLDDQAGFGAFASDFAQKDGGCVCQDLCRTRIFSLKGFRKLKLLQEGCFVEIYG